MSSYAGSPPAARPGETAGTLRLLAYLALAITLLSLAVLTSFEPRVFASPDE